MEGQRRSKLLETSDDASTHEKSDDVSAAASLQTEIIKIFTIQMKIPQVLHDLGPVFLYYCFITFMSFPISG